MTGSTDFPEAHETERPPSQGMIAMKDRLPLGVALLALVVAIAALVVAVGDTDDSGAQAAASSTTSVPAVTMPDALPTTTIGTVQTLPPATTVVLPVVTATTAAAAGEGADNDGADAPAPEPQLVLAVVGIGYDSTLNVREEPGGQIVAKLNSEATGIVPTGTVQELSDVAWHEVHAAGVLGWVSGEYVTPLGATVDTTTEVVARLGSTPTAANLAALGRTVAGAMASAEPESRVRISGEPTVDDVSEVTVDVVGQPDDSIRGYRLHVFATRSAGGFTLRNVEATLMCYTERGVSAQGLCN
ncbi:SH3 domain-containing protein [Candidatus Poriferisodalis sp.]|uniref:SH3 domain-containing protein n=1 Tax=Candidatus Poriferisodalis sp. TaxID=3101277 RepID=UPI003B012B86